MSVPRLVAGMVVDEVIRDIRERPLAQTATERVPDIVMHRDVVPCSNGLATATANEVSECRRCFHSITRRRSG